MCPPIFTSVLFQANTGHVLLIGSRGKIGNAHDLGIRACVIGPVITRTSVIFRTSTTGVGDDNGNVIEAEVIKMKLGEPDSSGRARPIAIPDSEYKIPCDLVVVSIGNDSNPILTATIPELELNRWGNIVTDPETGATNIPGIYAAGDIVTGSATVISAMGAARKAATAMHYYLTPEAKPKEEEASSE